MSGLTARASAFRSAISAFIEARRDAKLKGKEDDVDGASKYDYGTWLADAARRVGQIQAVTHVLKATHPDARGSSVHASPSTLPQHREIGTHVLGKTFAEDVVGNAAALDVYKFLKIEVEGRRLLDWMHEQDADLGRAMHDDALTAATWMTAFSSLVRVEAQPATHEAAKQVYWCVGDEPTDDSHYHLLQPMFSSSLAHAVHADIDAARFGDINRAARQAFRENQAHEGTYRDYRNLVARKLGGSNSQNVSQLNRERRGINYLLASLPPRWSRDLPRNLLGLDSALDQFAYFEGVKGLVGELIELLASNPGKVMETRQKRELIEQSLGLQLAVFAAAARARLAPGWTRESTCRLPRCEQLWLDPERTELAPREDRIEEDEAFNDEYRLGNWQDDVATRFANWVNDRLREAEITTVGDAEHKHWARQAMVDSQWPAPTQHRAGGQP